MKESTRGYLYRVALAVIPILAASGWISEMDAPLYVGLAAAVFSAGLATVNTSVKSDGE